MELKSPPPCPATVTVRRNPPRRARATPASVVPLREPLSSPSISRDIFATKITQQNPNNGDCAKIDYSTISLPENLKIFLRIRPPTIQKIGRAIAEPKNAWPKNPKVKSNAKPKTKKSSEICVHANDDLRSVTVSTPQPLQEMKRIKSEVYEGFSHVFTTESTQNDVYEKMVKPLVEDFLKGKSGMLAALGPSGSGKTHTVFGCARKPGMVPLALRCIFSEDESSTAHLSSRVVYLSMFEISSERGKSEKMIDLLHDGVDVCLQHSVIKGLREAVISDAQQAESLIARGMLKRATAMTNSNSQSSRSQCIINLRCGSKKGCEEVGGNASNNTLTIVDLAGAEKEKKTGNQGARLLESNFINNTSMVFGQCLRSLLEHQKNRNKTLQKHYKNSLLTRYLRDYLEGKKRMMLILTVKPGVEDYLDTSFLLRQASPFSKIKFKTVEEPVNLTNKRPNQALAQAGQLKRMKLGRNEISLIDEGKHDRSLPQNLRKESSGEAIEGCLEDIQVVYDENVNEIHALSNGFSELGIQEKLSPKGNDSKLKVKDTEYRILQGLSKGLWNVLKQYKEKLEGIEMENCHLRDSLANTKTRSQDLENELTNKNMRILDLENEVKELRTRCICCTKPSSNLFRESTHGPDVDLLQCQKAETPKVKLDILSPSSRGLNTNENDKVADPSAKDSDAIFASCSDGGDEQQQQQLEDISESRDDTENAKGFNDTSKVDTCFTSKVPSTSIDRSRELVFCEDICIVDIPSTSEADIQSTCRSLNISHKSDQDAVNIVGDVKNLESESESSLLGSLECESNRNTQDYEDLKDAEQQQIEDISECRDDTESAQGFRDTSKVDTCFNIKVPSASIDSSPELVFCEDICLVDIPSISEADIQSTCRSLNTSHKSDQDALNIVGDVKNVSSGSESCLVDSLECESNQDSEELNDAEQELTQLQSDNSSSLVEEHISADSHVDLKSSESLWNGDTCTHADVTDDGKSLVGEQNVPMASHSLVVDDLKPSESSQNGDTCNHVKEEGTLEPLGMILPKEGLDAQNVPKIVPEVASCNNQLTKKPRRRLQPVSSVLVKDLSLLDIKDENVKPKGSKTGKRATADEKSRTQGSLSLLNLLTSKLDR